MRPAIAPGFYTADELPNRDYHRSEGVSNSGLKLLNEKTPYHFWSAYIDEQGHRPTTRPQLLGSGLHAATLEPAEFTRQYVCAPFEARNAAGYKAWAKEQSKTILMPKEVEQVTGMHKSLHAHPVASRLIQADGGFEVSLYQMDPETGVMCKVRFDHLLSNNWIIDLKKTTDASEWHAAGAMATYYYHQQAAFYYDMLEWAQGECAGFAFVFIEENPPYAIAIYYLSEQDLDRGRYLYRKALNTYARCLALNKWPSYPTDPVELALPYRERVRVDNMRERD